MPSYTTTDIRNIALVGHGGAGKTTLAEAVLLKSGAIHTPGSVERGTTVTDHSDEEKTHGHSIFTSIAHCDFQGKHINLIDTPGYPDFIGQAFLALPAIETVAVVINATAGVEPNARRVMERAGARKLCRMIVVNKIDAENLDFAELIEQIQSAFGKECIPINLPTTDGKGVVDCFFSAEASGTTPTALGSCAEAHQRIVEQVVEVDEKLMELYLEQGDVKPDQLHEPFEKALREGHLIPVCFTSATRDVGIQELLEIIVKLAPNPLEGNPRPLIRGDDVLHELHAEPDPKKHVIAHVFQVTIDPFVGKLAAFRVHQGTVTTQTQLYVGDPRAGESKKPFKVGHLFKFQGKLHAEVDAAIPGDIAAVAKVDEIHRGAVLHGGRGP